MRDRVRRSSWPVRWRNVCAFLAACLALPPAAPAAPGEQPPEAAPFTLEALPFAVFGAGLGANPASAPLTLGALHAVELESRPAPDAAERRLLGTATLVGVGGTHTTAPLTGLGLLQGGDRVGCWELVNTDEARPIPDLFLKRFRDLRPFPDPVKEAPVYDAFCRVAVLAAQNTPDAFRRSAAENRLSYGTLFEFPAKHRGKVVHVEGDLRWARRLETPEMFRQAGLADAGLYEVWIDQKAVSLTPYCALLTELPPDIPLNHKLDVPVALDAYFVTRRHDPPDVQLPSKDWHDSLQLVGRSLTVQKHLLVTATARGRAALGAATLVPLGATPGAAALAEAALLRRGEQVGCWRLYNGDEVRPLPAELLAKIHMGRTLPGSASGGAEFDALVETLVQTWHTSPRAFAKAARHDVGFAQLFEHPADHLGDVVHLEGRLRLVKPWEPPLMAREAGVPAMYEAWLYDDVSGKNPYVLLVMELPPGVPLNQKVNLAAAFDGYFFKKWTYKALDAERAAPLLIGRALTVPQAAAAPQADEDSGAWTDLVAPAFLTALILAVGTVFVLTFWFRRGDARAGSRVHAVRRGGFVPPPAEGPPLARPLTPPREPSEN